MSRGWQTVALSQRAGGGAGEAANAAGQRGGAAGRQGRRPGETPSKRLEKHVDSNVLEKFTRAAPQKAGRLQGAPRQLPARAGSAVPRRVSSALPRRISSGAPRLSRAPRQARRGGQTCQQGP